MATYENVEPALYAIVMGGALIVYGVKRVLKVRKTQDTATSKMASAPQGFVEVEGYAWHGGSYFTNIDGRRTVYCDVKLQKLVKSGKNSEWRTITSTGLTQPFFVLDETGVALVVAEQFEIESIEKTFDWNKIKIESRQKLLKLFSTKTNDLPDLDPGFFSRNYRCVEKFILLGSPILIHGRFDSSVSSQKPKFDSAFFTFYEKMKHYRRDKRRAQTFLDLNQDGFINEHEMRIGMHSTAISSFNKQPQNTVDLKFCGTLLGHDQHKSFIADCHQDHFLKRLDSLNMLSILGGLIVILGGIWIFLLANK